MPTPPSSQGSLWDWLFCSTDAFLLTQTAYAFLVPLCKASALTCTGALPLLRNTMTSAPLGKPIFRLTPCTDVIPASRKDTCLMDKIESTLLEPNPPPPPTFGG